MMSASDTTSSNRRLRILFLCTGNACRSQMAEGWARALKGDSIDAVSAGIVAKGLDPRAVAVMAEAGVDISGQRSKMVDELPDTVFDYIITLCNNAKESCPYFPGEALHLHRGFDDPPALAAGETDEEARLSHYRVVRDEIRDFILGMPGNITPA